MLARLNRIVANLKAQRRAERAEEALAQGKTNISTLTVQITARDTATEALREFADLMETQHEFMLMGAQLVAVPPRCFNPIVEFPELDRAIEDNFNIRFGAGYSGQFNRDSNSPYLMPPPD